MTSTVFAPKHGKLSWLAAWRAGLVLLLCLWLAPLVAASDSPWDPVPPSELTATAPKDKSGADAEVLFSRISIAPEKGMFVQRQYYRVKAYTPHGVDEIHDIALNDYGAKLKGLGARVIHLDGSTREFTEKDFSKNNVQKIHSTSMNELRLIIPDLAPGDMVEARWEIWRDTVPQWLSCQGPIPIRNFDFTLAANDLGVNVAWYHVAHPVVQESPAQLRLQLTDLPAFIPEPDMPPRFECSATLFLSSGQFYEKQSQGWVAYSRWLLDMMYKFSHASFSVDAKASQLIAGVTSDQDKLRRLYEFCQTQIRNVDYDDGAALAEDRHEDDHAYQLASETLTLRRGHAYEINSLFAALASSCGFEVRLAASAKRDELGQVGIPNGWRFVQYNSVAVKHGDHFVFFAPGDRFVPFGMLPWFKEGMQAVLGDPKKLVESMTPNSEPDKTRMVRKAQLRLDADGELVGDVAEILTGHQAINWRMRYWNRPADEIETAVQASVTSHIPDAELTEIHVANLRESEPPLVIRYHLRVPGFATAAGSRLVFTPDVFLAGTNPRFTNETRQFPVEFGFARQFHDDINIDLPEGYAPDSGDMPAPVDAGTITQKIFIGYGHGKSRRYIHYEQDFSLGAGGATRLPADKYALLKQLFDLLHANEVHALVLRKATPAARPSVLPGSDQPNATPAPAARQT